MNATPPLLAEDRERIASTLVNEAAALSPKEYANSREMMAVNSGLSTAEFDVRVGMRRAYFLALKESGPHIDRTARLNNVHNYRGSAQPLAALTEAENPHLKAVTAAELVAHKFPPRDPLLGDWLMRQSLAMIHAWRGIGKTYFALNVAYAAASGGQFLKWSAPKPTRCLYIDGEMPGIALQERLSALAISNEREPADGHLKFITPDLQQGPMPDLATPEGQIAIKPFVDDSDLIVVDNLSCLARHGGRENEGESWLSIADWALRQRAAGRAVLFVHHSGKAGSQRGTSRREDVLDVVLGLRRPVDYRSEEGARFVVSFEKARGLTGDAVAEFEASLTQDAEGRQTWAIRNCQDAELHRVAELVLDGATQSDIAEELDQSRFQAGRRIKDAIAKGLISQADVRDGRSRNKGRTHEPNA